MAVNQTPSQSGIKQFYKSKLVWLLIVLSGAVLYFSFFDLPISFGSGSETTNAKPTAVQTEQTITRVKKVRLCPCHWSEWISIAKLKPPEVPDCARFQFQVNAPDWHEYCFWNGRTVRVCKNETGWLGKISDSTFKLRGGEGEATVTIQYFFRQTKTP